MLLLVVFRFASTRCLCRAVQRECCVPAFAQGPAANDESLEEIVVTGFRQSLNAALEEKRLTSSNSSCSAFCVLSAKGVCNVSTRFPRAVSRQLPALLAAA